MTVATPVVGAPVMLAEWKLEPDTAQRLVYRTGSITPVGGVADVSGFAQIARTFGGSDPGQAVASAGIALALLLLAFAVWRGALQDRVFKFTMRYWSALIVGGMALTLAGVAFFSLADIVSHEAASLPRDLTFLAPVQHAGNSLSVEVDNLDEKSSAFNWVGSVWPVLLALAAFGYAWRARRPVVMILGWTLLAWAALRCQNGAGMFLAVIAAFFAWHLAVPALLRFWRAPRAPKPVMPPAGGAAAATALLLFALFVHGVSAQDAAPLLPKASPVAETVIQQVRVEEKFVFATAKVHWQAVKGQRLPLLFEPAVLHEDQLSGRSAETGPGGCRPEGRAGVARSRNRCGGHRPPVSSSSDEERRRERLRHARAVWIGEPADAHPGQP